jgi:hypothetical protein
VRYEPVKLSAIETVGSTKPGSSGSSLGRTRLTSERIRLFPPGVDLWLSGSTVDVVDVVVCVLEAVEEGPVVLVRPSSVSGAAGGCIAS